MYVFCLSCPSATFALRHGGFVPREWLAAKGLLIYNCLLQLFDILLNLFRTASKDIHDDVVLIHLVLRISARQL